MNHNDTIDFTRWSKLSATLSSLPHESHDDVLDEAGIEPDAFNQAERRHLREMSARLDRGDRSLADQHIADLMEAKAHGTTSAEAEALAATADGAAPPPVGLPFVCAQPSSAFEAELRQLREEVGPSSDAGATLDPAPRTKEDTLPFGSHRNLDLLRIESYAEFSASYEAAPDKASVMESFQIRDVEQLTALERYWQRRFSAEPWLKSQFEVLVQRHRRSG